MRKILNRKPWKKTCGICKAQDVAMIKYENSNGIQMLFCTSCQRYPERRMFKVIKHYPGKNLAKQKNLLEIEIDNKSSRDVREKYCI